jgi:anti-sigma regulatory factor (Ser/Thr protein kinase)
MTATTHRHEADAFRHDLLLYDGEADLVEHASGFVRDGLDRGEAVLAAVGARTIELLGARLGDAAEGVTFLDMATVGRNPARIIPVWQRFVDVQRGRGTRPRGIGEPVWPGRSEAELAECRRHESLLNLAFADGPAWTLLCPYDRRALAPAVIAEAERTHPHVAHGGARLESPSFEGHEAAARPFDDPLPEPPDGAVLLCLSFSERSLGDVRRLVAENAAAAGLGERRRDELVLAANEVATNSIRHGGGTGTLRLWAEPPGVVCEVRDSGSIPDPLAGRRTPELDGLGGRGLWLANHLCDLVELRSSAGGTVVRLHVRD